MSLFFRIYTIFDHSACSVSNSRRFMAYIIDWFLGSLCTMLPMCMLWMYWTKNVETMGDANVLYIAGQIGNTEAYIAGALSILFALFYYVYIPWKVFPGQTPGKRAMNFKIVGLDDHEVTLKQLLIRQVFGIILLEGALYSVSGIIYSVLTLATNINILTITKFIGVGLGIFSAFLVMKMESHRMLHDYIAKTKVIEHVVEQREDERI